MTRLPSASNFIPFDMPLGERNIVACLLFGSYFQMLSACGYFPDGSLQRAEKVMSLKYTMPSGPVATPSLSLQAPSNRRSNLAPAGSTLGSPVGAGNPGSSAHALPAAARKLITTDTAQMRRQRRPHVSVAYADASSFHRMVMRASSHGLDSMPGREPSRCHQLN